MRHGRLAVVPAALALTLFGVAFATRVFAYQGLDLLVLALLYASLAVCLHAGSGVLARIAAPLALPASLAVGAVLVWHLREQGLVWLMPLGFAVAGGAVGLVHFALLLLERRIGSARSMADLCGGAAVVFATLLVASFSLSNTLRWQLLHQNKLIGVPAYYLLSEPTQAVREALWAAHEGKLEPASPAPEGNGAAPGRPPHIVFVLVDTLRADALQAYGAERLLMPELDRIAVRSIVFRDVLANASWTRPSVASFFTGLLPEEHGAVDRVYGLADRWWVLAEILRARGYATAAFVSNYGAVGRDAGFDQGFDHFEEIEGRPYARAAEVNAAVERWLERFHRSERRRQLPLFLYVHYLDPHSPDLAGYAPRSLETSELRRGYDAELGYTDAWLGRLFDFLEAQLPAPRFVFLTSDHGEEFGEHGGQGHGHSLYEELVRLPALLTGADGPSGALDARLEARDFFDLLQRLAHEPALDVAGWAGRRDRGQRYLSTWGATPMGWHRPYYRYVGLRGIESDGFFLVWSAYGNTWELYDLGRDPGQTRNVVRDNPERTRELAAAMDESVRWWARRKAIRHSDETLDLLRALGYVE